MYPEALLICQLVEAPARQNERLACGCPHICYAGACLAYPDAGADIMDKRKAPGCGAQLEDKPKRFFRFPDNGLQAVPPVEIEYAPGQYLAKPGHDAPL